MHTSLGCRQMAAATYQTSAWPSSTLQATLTLQHCNSAFIGCSLHNACDDGQERAKPAYHGNTQDRMYVPECSGSALTHTGESHSIHDNHSCTQRRLEKLDQNLAAKRRDYLDFPMPDTYDSIGILDGAYAAFEDALEKAAYATAQGLHADYSALPLHFRSQVIELTSRLEDTWRAYKQARLDSSEVWSDQRPPLSGVSNVERPLPVPIVQHDGLVDRVCGEYLLGRAKASEDLDQLLNW